jgi:cytochrome c553
MMRGSGMRDMTGTPFNIAIFGILAVALMATVAPAARAESLAIRNCTWCHGGSAQGYAPAPRLAGQQPQYLMNQLANFHSHTRDNPHSRLYMWGAASNLTPQTARDLAAYFSKIAPEPANDGDRESVATGRTIYQEGMPDANIVACVVCHGPNAEGIGPIPRLSGLAYTYLQRRLEQWGQGYHEAVGPPMPDIAAKLSPAQTDALSSYLSFLK